MLKKKRFFSVKDKPIHEECYDIDVFTRHLLSSYVIYNSS